MPRLHPFLRYGLPLLAWMIVIFSASHDSGSVERTSRFLVPFLKWLRPDLPPETIATIRHIVRKIAHAVEYAILAWLAWRVFRRPVWGDLRTWSRRPSFLALAVVVGYAITDEVHQGFVPNRQGSPVDVLIDTAGGCLGLGLTRLGFELIRWRRRAVPARPPGPPAPGRGD